MEKELYYALTQIDPQRAHITLTIEDFDCITEDRRYVFYNKGDSPVSLLPLPARERKPQRNMKVEDAANRNLVFIPSSSSTDIFVETCTIILEKSNHYLNESQKKVFKKIREDIQPNLNKVFTYKPTPEDIKSVYENIGDILHTDIFKSEEKFIREIFPLVELLKQYNNELYYPLIALSEPFQPHHYMLIKLTVEKLREYLKYKKERLRILAEFGFLGRFTFSFKPELHP